MSIRPGVAPLQCRVPAKDSNDEDGPVPPIYGPSADDKRFAYRERNRAFDMLYLTQLVYVNDGEERTFQAFEDVAIPLISKYRGELLLRIRPNAESIISAGIEVPYEIHVVRFDSEDDLQRFSEDEERQRALHLKNTSVRKSLLVRGTAA